MAKKKKSKKHNFNQAKQQRAARPVNAPVAGETIEAEPTRVNSPVPVASTYELQHHNEIVSDIRRVAVLAVSFVALQLVLWFLFNHTSLGPNVYHLIKL